MTAKLKGRSILITGANGGIGMETVKLLIQEQAARIVLAARTDNKANWAKANLPATATTQLEAQGGFDMNDVEQIRQAVHALPEDQPFDIVFLQSGGMVVADDFQFVQVNGTSIERTVQQNAIGGYLTVAYLKERNLLAPHARVVFAGGEGARGIPGLIQQPAFPTAADFREYLFQGTGAYHALNAIGVSKFASALLVQKLATLDTQREYVWFSPGLTGGTNGLDTLPNPKRFVMKHIGFPIMQLLGLAQGPKTAARKYVAALAGEHGENGDIIGAPEGKALGKLVDQKPMNPSLTNLQLRDAFWDILSQTYGAFFTQKPSLQIS